MNPKNKDPRRITKQKKKIFIDIFVLYGQFAICFKSLIVLRLIHSNFSIFLVKPDIQKGDKHLKKSCANEKNLLLLFFNTTTIDKGSFNFINKKNIK